MANELSARWFWAQRALDAGAAPEWVRQNIPALPSYEAGICEHPAALLVLADALATCDGCGRVFELRDFGK